MTDPMGFPAVMAAADLGDRAGAKSWEIMWMCPHTPDEEDGHDCGDVTWHITAMYQGHRIAGEGLTAEAAALEFAVKLIDGGRCKCGRTVAMQRAHQSPRECLWRLEGERWEPGCDAPSIEVEGTRGDLGAMLDSFTRAAARMGEVGGMYAMPTNRAGRRAAARAKRKKGK